MTGAGVTLLIGWILGHLLVVASIADQRKKRWLFLVAGICFLLVYLVKPYSYDLAKYSIFFNTGFIQTEVWGWNFADTIELLPQDRTGEPFESGFEVGFRLLAKIGSATFPSGGLIPRFGPDSGKFGQATVPPADAMLYLIAAFGFFLLYASVKLYSKGNDTDVSSINFLDVAPIILGSVFFVLGSQNVLRQFLGIAFIVLAMSMLRSNRYVSSVMLILVSGVFHSWAPFFGMIGLLIMMLGETRPGIRTAREIGPTRLEREEIWLICIGVITVVFFKIISVGKRSHNRVVEAETY